MSDVNFVEKCPQGRIYRVRFGLPSPPTQLFAQKGELDFHGLCSSLGLPFLIKPTDRSGGEGVIVVRDLTEFNSRVLRDVNFQYTPVIAQAFVAGHDIDISLVANEGCLRSYAIQVQHGRARRFLQNSELLSLAEEFIKNVGYSGVAHIDARRCGDGGIQLIEFNARVWASLNAATWCGLNFVREAIAAKRGGENKSPSPSIQGCLGPVGSVGTLLAAAKSVLTFQRMSKDQLRLVRGAIFMSSAKIWNKMPVGHSGRPKAPLELGHL